MQLKEYRMNDSKFYNTGFDQNRSFIEFQPWYGELGWEIMSWIPFCRKKALNYDRVIASSFGGMAPLYADFATEFRPHDKTDRGLDYPKMYRVEGIFHQYGRAEDAVSAQEVLIHARGVRRKSSINYHQWPELAKGITGLALTTAFIGTKDDQHVLGYYDYRGIDLQKLMNRIARAKLVIGASSGIMHLAAACGIDLIIWGDSRTYFSQTLERRYKETWNPFDVRVGWLTADDWQPEPIKVIKKIKEML